MKKLFRAMAVLVLSLFLVACSGDATDKEVTIKVWTGSLTGEPFDTYFAELKADFESKNENIKIEFEDIPLGEMEQKVLTSLTGSDVPDIVNLNPHFMGNIAAQGGLAELNDLVKDINLEETYLEGPLQANQIDGKQYALPWYLTTGVSWYNGADFDKAKVTTAPTTLSDLLTVSQTIKDATGKAVYYPVVNDGNTIMEKMVTLSNGTLLVDNGVVKLSDNKVLLEYFDTMQKMYEQGLIPQEAADGSIKVGQELFMANKVSLIEGGVTFISPAQEGAPAVFDVSRAGQPLGEENAPVNVAVMNFAIPSKSENKEAAAIVLLYLTNAENQLKFSKTAGSVLPSTKVSLQDDYFNNPGDGPKAEGMQIAAKSLERAKVLIPPTENSAQLREETKNVFVENLQGKITPEEALAKLEAAWTKLFEETQEKVSF